MAGRTRLKKSPGPLRTLKGAVGPSENVPYHLQTSGCSFIGVPFDYYPSHRICTTQHCRERGAQATELAAARLNLMCQYIGNRKLGYWSARCLILWALHALHLKPASSVTLKLRQPENAPAWAHPLFLGTLVRATEHVSGKCRDPRYVLRRTGRWGVQSRLRVDTLPWNGGRLLALRAAAGELSDGTLNVHVVLPCLNEERVLPTTLRRVCHALEQQTHWNWRVTVVDNGSTDGTSNVTRDFANGEKRVALIRLEERGRGRALRAAWLNDTADIQSYMDVDLSTDIDAFPRLVQCVANGTADIAVASRRAPGASVVGRSPLRALTSHGLSLLIRSLFWRFSVSDTQCGCKVNIAIAESP